MISSKTNPLVTLFNFGINSLIFTQRVFLSYWLKVHSNASQPTENMIVVKQPFLHSSIFARVFVIVFVIAGTQQCVDHSPTATENQQPAPGSDSSSSLSRLSFLVLSLTFLGRISPSRKYVGLVWSNEVLHFFVKGEAYYKICLKQ